MKYQQYLEALATLEKIDKEQSKYYTIHYACESFYCDKMAKTPRITAIAIRSLESGQTYSFSMHQTAEILGIDTDEISNRYDEIEFNMLQDFAIFLKNHKDINWIHWNMRDVNYGFQAIEHRYKILQNKMRRTIKRKVEMENINDSNKVDLSLLLIRKYGSRYIGNPRMQKLMEENKLNPKDFLTGQEEAEAFANNELHKLLMSTLEKVNLLSIFTQKAIDNDLKHHGRSSDVCDSWGTIALNYLNKNFYGYLISMLISALIGHYGPIFLTWICGNL